MLKKSLMLVGLAALLVLVGSSVSWAAQGQQGASLDPGQMVSDNVATDKLIADALPLIVKAGYEVQQFDFQKAVAELWRDEALRAGQGSC